MFRLLTKQKLTSYNSNTLRYFAAPSTASGLNLSIYGINPSSNTKIYRNLSYDDIYQHELQSNTGTVVKNGTYAVDTGKFTGRSPKDKYIVENKPSSDNIWWGPVNRPMKPEVFERLHNKVSNHFSTNAKNIYVFDGYSGVNLDTRKKVRFITEIAWQHHFVTNMFLRPKDASEIENFEPDFTVSLFFLIIYFFLFIYF